MRLILGLCAVLMLSMALVMACESEGEPTDGSASDQAEASSTAVATAAPGDTSPSTDREALAAFYHATNGPGWILNRGWLTDRTLEYWYGVSTDSYGRVTELKLPGNELSGTIPAELGNLDRLRVLDLTASRIMSRVSFGQTKDITQMVEEEASFDEIFEQFEEQEEDFVDKTRRLLDPENFEIESNYLSGCVPTSLREQLDLNASDLGGLPFCDEKGALNPTKTSNEVEPGTAVSSDAMTYASVSAGWLHTCGVTIGGDVLCWGDDEDGAATPPEGAFTSVSAGSRYTCGVKADGSINCWGVEWFGNTAFCSNGQSNCREAEWNYQPIPTGRFTSVSVGGGHICAIRIDESVSCWRQNSEGEATPPQGTFAQVDAGSSHTCGVKADGSVACWGFDNFGQAAPPEGVFTSVSAGSRHTCGIKSDGDVLCWGDDKDGRATPPEGVFTSVSVAEYYSCGVKDDGSVACWGDDKDGRATPPEGVFTSVSAGEAHTCGIMTNGLVACWGNTRDGLAAPP